MIHAPRSRRLSLLTLTALLAGSAAVFAPALPAASSVPVQQTIPLASEISADSLTSSLTALAATSPAPTRDQLRAAFTGAGFRGDSVEVSLDRTPTGLAVDSIRGAAIKGDECLFGEVREGQVSVAVLPVLDSGFCFVGDQR